MYVGRNDDERAYVRLDASPAFLEQVADEVSLALRNAWSYAALEAQRRRLEVANVVGRKLASSRDRWSIVRTLREELSRHLEFDLFSLATVEHGSQGPTALAHVYASGEDRQSTGSIQFYAYDIGSLERAHARAVPLYAP